jgi:hypothetical protein
LIVDSDNGNNKNNVQFSTVHVREYNLCLGDNPSVTCGAPISLDWYYEKEQSYSSVDEYEFSSSSSSSSSSTTTPSKTATAPKPSSPSSRYTRLKRPSFERLHILMNSGYSRKEIKDATNDAQIIRKQRSQTKSRVERTNKLLRLLKKITNNNNNNNNQTKSAANIKTTVVVHQKKKMKKKRSSSLSLSSSSRTIMATPTTSKPKKVITKNMTDINVLTRMFKNLGKRRQSTSRVRPIQYVN